MKKFKKKNKNMNEQGIILFKFKIRKIYMKRRKEDQMEKEIEYEK